MLDSYCDLEEIKLITYETFMSSQVEGFNLISINPTLLDDN